VQLGGKQIALHEDKKEAEREFYRIMAAEGRLDDRQARASTLADACEALLAQSQHLRRRTLEIYQRYLGLLAGSPFGTKRLERVDPGEVIRWIQSTEWKYGGDGSASRYILFRFTKQLFRWARDTGLIPVNSFARLHNPWKIMPRTRPMTDEEFKLIMGRPRLSPQFREVIEMVWRTGIRPGELCTLAARHLDAQMPIARFQPTEHKTGTRTGLQREVYFPPDLWERLQGYAQVHKQGPLLRRKNGVPWTSKKISSLFNELKNRLGLTCVLYQARHRFLTNLLDNGVPLARVAKIAGHTDTRALMKTYYHPEVEEMASNVGAVADKDLSLLAETEAAKAADKEAQRDKYLERHRRYYQKRAARGRASDGPPSASGT
jgi:integrase